MIIDNRYNVKRKDTKKRTTTAPTGRAVAVNELGLRGFLNLGSQLTDSSHDERPIPSPRTSFSIGNHRRWVCHRFCLSFRDVEDLLAASGNAKDTAAKPRIHVELKMLGINMSERTVSGILRSCCPVGNERTRRSFSFLSGSGSKIVCGGVFSVSRCRSTGNRGDESF